MKWQCCFVVVDLLVSMRREEEGQGHWRKEERKKEELVVSYNEEIMLVFSCFTCFYDEGRVSARKERERRRGRISYRA